MTPSFAEQAATWIVRLTDDDPDERIRAREGFDAWKRADSRHAAAAAELEQFADRLQRVRDGGVRPARAALNATLAARRRPRARRAGAALVLIAAMLWPAWLFMRASGLSADLHSATGEWQTHVLADGSRITLGSGAAVNVHVDAQRRVVELVRGDVLVDVAPDASRPFDVETAHGRVRALGTRFSVQREAQFSELAMLESKVELRGAAAKTAVIDAGWRVRFDAQGIAPATAFDPRSVDDAWRLHQLVVSGRPLPEVLDVLSRHRRGVLTFDREQLAAIRVSAVLPLDDTDKALQLLAASFPQLRLRERTPYWVRIDVQ